VGVEHGEIQGSTCEKKKSYFGEGNGLSVEKWGKKDFSGAIKASFGKLSKKII